MCSAVPIRAGSGRCCSASLRAAPLVCQVTSGTDVPRLSRVQPGYARAIRLSRVGVPAFVKGYFRACLCAALSRALSLINSMSCPPSGTSLTTALSRTALTRMGLLGSATGW